MCGIVGIWDTAAPSVNQLHDQIVQLTDALVHRGPDDSGHWIDPDCCVALGHRRLSILDLSPAGRQPMPSFCGRFQLIFNGELYNYRELRKALEAGGVAFRSTSDTEVLAAGLSHWGFEELLQRAIGMWAFAAWDQQRKSLLLARDRLGIKPLYYQWSGGRVLFGSELKALRRHPQFRSEVDRGAVAQLLRYGYIPAPQSIYQDTWKLPPGTWLEISDPAAAPSLPHPYWSLETFACGPRKELSDQAALEQWEEKFTDAVSLRMVSDVPLGAFLSGGIDSSLVVAAMQNLSTSAVKTFCIGFEEQAYDESPHARAIAGHLGTDHCELIVTASQARDVIPGLATIYDEPFADSSQIPTILVSRLAREHVTVSLSGDGGDELFAGYTRYAQFANRWKQLRRLPAAARRTSAAAMRWTAATLPPSLGEKFRRRALGVDVHSPAELYAVHNAHWKDAENVVLGDPVDLGCHWKTPSCPLAPQELWMATDTVNYLPDDILVKVDRASMSCGLEARVPLLDHRIVEWSWSLPWTMKVREGKTKWLLREALSRHVPRELFERPKMGFGVPIGQWLRGSLRDWADDLLHPQRLERQGLIDPGRVTDIWQRHRSGDQNWEYLLWDVLMLQSWLDVSPFEVSPFEVSPSDAGGAASRPRAGKEGM